MHRLLADNSVDLRMREILAGKLALFDEYVRRSDLKEISADSVDISNLETTRIYCRRDRLPAAAVQP